MKQITALIIFALLVLAVGFFIGRSCSETKDIDIDPILKAIEQSQKNIDSVNAEIRAIKDSISLISQKRFEQINYYTYEITKIDSAYPNSSIAYWDSVLLDWTAIIYNLPGFFQIEVDSIKPIQNSENSTAGD